MFTKTITLAGEALSSFLAAGGQTVDPNAQASTSPAPAAANAAPTVSQVPFPIAAAVTTPTTTPASPTTPSPAIVLQTPTSVIQSTTAEVKTTTSSIPSTTTLSSTSTSSSTPSSTPLLVASTRPAISSAATSAAAISSVLASAAPSTITHAPSSSRPAISLKAVSHAASSVSARSSARSIGSDALSSSVKTASSSHGLSGGGIAGLIIGLLVAFSLIGTILFFLHKRRNERKREEEDTQRQLAYEKGMVHLDESEVSTPTGGNGGFDFGNLPATTQKNHNTPPTDYFRSASPAQMQAGAAALGIQRPFTPPPGHPAHPNYRQPPALAAAKQMQQQQPAGIRSVTPQNGPIRKAVPAPAMPSQRQTSSNNPFTDPSESANVAPPLAHATGPAHVISKEADPRVSLDSFIAGDDSFDEEEHDVQAQGAAPSAPIQEVATPAQPENDSKIPVQRSKSVMEASDNWAARKAHLKTTLALQTSSNPTTPAPEQSPFADPVPVIEHEIAVLSPMNLEFNRESEKI